MATNQSQFKVSPNTLTQETNRETLIFAEGIEYKSGAIISRLALQGDSPSENGVAAATPVHSKAASWASGCRRPTPAAGHGADEALTSAWALSPRSTSRVSVRALNSAAKDAHGPSPAGQRPSPPPDPGCSAEGCSVWCRAHRGAGDPEDANS